MCNTTTAFTNTNILLIALLIVFLALANANAFECSVVEFGKHLPSNATVAFAYPIAENSTFDVPASDIAYPVSPTQLRELCVVQVNVKYSNTSTFAFGLFLPRGWNHRFLYGSQWSIASDLFILANHD